MSPSGWKSLGRYDSVGFELSAMIVIGFFLGRWVDRHFGWNAIGTMGGVALGVYSGFRMLFKRAKEAEREMKENNFQLAIAMSRAIELAAEATESPLRRRHGALRRRGGPVVRVLGDRKADDE